MIHDEDTFTARTPDGERVTLRVKRDGEPGGLSKVAKAGQSKGPVERRERLIRKFERIFAGEADDDADRNHDASSDPIRPPPVDHHVSRVADLIVEGSGGKIDRAVALHHLLHTVASLASHERRRGAFEPRSNTQGKGGPSNGHSSLDHEGRRHRWRLCGHCR
jgi:hypothetical protein